MGKMPVVFTWLVGGKFLEVFPSFSWRETFELIKIVLMCLVTLMGTLYIN